MRSTLCRIWRFTLLLLCILTGTVVMAQSPAPVNPQTVQSQASSASDQSKSNAAQGKAAQATAPDGSEGNPQPAASGSSAKTEAAPQPELPQQAQPSQEAQTAQQTQPSQQTQPNQQAQPAQADQKPAAGDPAQAGQSQSSASNQQQPGAAQTTGAQDASKDSQTQEDDANKKKQTKRIFWILPNNRAVSSDTQLPPLSAKGKLWLAAKDSFDYSSFLNVSILAAIGLAHNSTPEFHQGLKGYGTYFWHSWLDLADGNFMTEGVFPALTKQDPRFYTLGHGSFVKRAGYAASRIFITRTDSGKTTFNISEIAGNGAAAGISATYYPQSDRNIPTVGKNWATQVGLDMLSYIFKEFWPDINHALFHNRY